MGLVLMTYRSINPHFTPSSNFLWCKRIKRNYKCLPHYAPTIYCINHLILKMLGVEKWSDVDDLKQQIMEFDSLVTLLQSLFSLILGSILSFQNFKNEQKANVVKLLIDLTSDQSIYSNYKGISLICWTRGNCFSSW